MLFPAALFCFRNTVLGEATWPFGVRQAGCEQSEKQAERQCATSAFCARR
jgi:hypothetical protein